VNCNNEEIRIMKLGPCHAFEKEPEFFVKELIIDTENAIRHLDVKLHNTYRIMASKKKKKY
jgi:Ni,Fe-hydrogenase III large subunit